MSNAQPIINFIRSVFRVPEAFIPLHAPYFGGNEKKYVLDTIESTFVSSVGAYVHQFEAMMQSITGAKHCIATVNGTTALHLALQIAGATHNTEVITQPLTFVATANAIAHTGASPVFIDVDKDTLGLSPAAFAEFLEKHVVVNDEGYAINTHTGKRIVACVPMHTFGFPARIEAISELCSKYHIALVEDAAESLGSYVGEKHTGTFGIMGTFSFNGNKTVTCGGGGAIITNDDAIAQRAKHLSTTAKLPHAYEFVHDEVAYNYRMPNINAALACAQLEQLDKILTNKKDLASTYTKYFNELTDVSFVTGIENTVPNYWLNTLVFNAPAEQQSFLQKSNEQKVMTRPIWQLMNELPMYKNCLTVNVENATYLSKRVVNIPSSYRP
ncbi:MAG TPA: aminotransferase DegT [Chitinophagaceae bacterium]|nr:aminotransferase DegT [Chitinophagaceae bacterium]HAN39432.1 aminotransferase DegT [Chitinophagaceae bacterium]